MALVADWSFVVWVWTPFPLTLVCGEALIGPSKRSGGHVCDGSVFAVLLPAIDHKAERHENRAALSFKAPNQLHTPPPQPPRPWLHGLSHPGVQDHGCVR